jgi:hypothetical protein
VFLFTPICCFQFSFRDRTVSFIKTGDSTSIKCYPCSTFTKLDKSDADSDGTKLTVLTVGAEKNMNKAIWFNTKVERGSQCNNAE